MSPKKQENRVIRFKRLLNKLKHPEEPDVLWFLSDENLDPDQKVSKSNDRSLFLSSVMVPAIVSNDTTIFYQGLRVTSRPWVL